MKKVSLKMTNLNRFHFTTNLILIAFLSIFIYSCSNDDDGQPTDVIKELPQDIKDLIYFTGDEKASTVLISVPGGPSTEFGTDLVDYISATFNTTDILNVTVHQAQTINPDIVSGNDITLDQAVTFNTESIETLFKVIKYFKDQDRVVYVLGVSFGAFITQELIAKNGIDSADKYLIISSRLDMNDVIWQGAAEGREGGFENGITPIVKEEPDPNVMERNLNRIFAGLVKNRYTQLFNPITDLSSLTYIYGTTDDAVGSLTAEEVKFLESRNTNIIAGNGNHDDTFFGFIAQGFNEAFGIK